MIVLREADIRTLLPMEEAIERMRSAFDGLAAGTAVNQPRRRLILPTGAVLHSLAGACGDYFGTKIYSTHARHGAHFFFLLFDSATATPLAMMEANCLGQIRTGAATGYATSLMAPPGEATLGVIGAGFQAASQIEAVRAVRPVGEVRVWSRNELRRREFAQSQGAVAAASAEAAVRGASIVITATNAKEPVFEADWIAPGAHVNAVGSNIANRRELPAELLRRAAVVAVDSLEQARIEAGDIILAEHWSNVIELKDWRGRARPGGITVFKSVGLGVEDVAVGGWVYEKARKAGMGIPWPAGPVS